MQRANNFDFLRLVAALSVIFSHSFLLAEGTEGHEPLVVLSGGQSILGLAGVFVFFTISGYLVTQSWERTESPLRFVLKRALRIFPGLLVCLLFCTFVLGLVVTTLPSAAYLTDGRTYGFVVRNMLMNVSYNHLPGVSFGNPGTDDSLDSIVNGPLWTLPSELVMYGLVLALGSLRLLSLRVTLTLLLAGLVCLAIDTSRTHTLLGNSAWLMGAFAMGMCLYRLRGTRILDGRLALAAALGLVATARFGLFLPLFPIFGSYLTIWLAFTRKLPPVPVMRVGDLSYGLYIYGWPAEQLVVWYSGGTAAWWEVFLYGVAIAVPLAWLSWRLVEAPALRLKGLWAAGVAPHSAGAGRPLAANERSW